MLLFLGWGKVKLCLSRGSGGDVTFFFFSFIFVKQCKIFISFFLSLHPSLFAFFLSFFFLFFFLFYVRVGRGIHIWVTGHLWNRRSYILLGIVEWHGAVWIMSVHWLLLRSWLHVEPYVLIEKTR